MLRNRLSFHQVSRALVRCSLARHSSTINFSKLEVDLKARTFPAIYDYLSPQPSYLLDQSLKDFLAAGTFPDVQHPSGHSLPPGHHLVYFPTPTTASQLLPDGTDTLHSPGPPFTQRLWAGGRVQFLDPVKPCLDGRKAVLAERVQDVRVAGEKGSEKIFVGIERRMGFWQKRQIEEWKQVFHESPNVEPAFIAERRDLCFLREDASALSRFSTSQRSLKPPTDSTFVFPLTPTSTLLFRFSALTFNAHAIHIDPEYTRSVYGLPKLLVHGPLCLTLMLECLSRALDGTGSKIREFTYRNFRPLFVGEELRVCGRQKSLNGGKNSTSENPDWEVWIETGEGETAALAVRGTASCSSSDPKTST